MSKSPTSFQDVLLDEQSSYESQRVAAPIAAAVDTSEAAFTTQSVQPPLGAVPAQQGPIGLALSGGGIRSATFSLGVLQALGKAGKLASFDYLSTVSGGGYIGGWLSAWIHRASLAHVQSELGRSGSASPASPQDVEPEEISWLRRYSNYLSPQLGILSTDTLTLVSIWVRNVFLNLIVVISFLAALLLMPRLLLPMLESLLPYHAALGSAAAWLGMLILPLAICSNLLHMERHADERGFWLASSRAVIVTVLLPGALAAFLGSIWLFSIPASQHIQWLDFIEGPLTLLAVVLLVWVIVELRRGLAAWTVFKEAVVYALSGVIAIAVGVGLLRGAYELLSHMWNPQPFAASPQNLAMLITMGPPAFLVMFGIAGFVFVGLIGRVYFERSREWWSRMNALFTTAGLWWFLLTACAFYVPPLVDLILVSAATWVKTLAGIGWVGSLVTALLAPKSKVSSQLAQQSMARVLNVAVFIVMVGFIMMVSAATDYTLVAMSDHDRTEITSSPRLAKVDLTMSSDGADASTSLAMQIDRRPGLADFTLARMQDLGALLDMHGYLPMAFGIVLFVLLIFGWRVDVNKFSLHNMYKNRLIRCYLGASNARRSAQPFTGFDERDDLELTCLGGSARNNGKPQRPLHLINAALNISQGKNLAWQERKAASFVFTPQYCGFFLAKTQGDTTENEAKKGRANERGLAPVFTGIDDGVRNFSAGYQPTKQYASEDDEERGFTLGMAMATSGAAASPNMGPATQPALAFLMTIFNVRLGRWSPNPAGSRWKVASPRFGLMCLLQELFGKSDETSDFIYLSDGGHFDNMGIYELIRRRCQTIWVVDAAADPERNFSDLGRAVRQCRIDFGVEISFPGLKNLNGETNVDLPECGFTVGEIKYGLGWPSGKIVYIKPTLCKGKGEPVDILAYAARNPSFPQQTTADQFFDESQFESYRRLGLHIGTACLAANKDDLPDVVPDAFMPAAATVVPRKPQALWKWFVSMLIATVLLFAFMGSFRSAYMPCVKDADIGANLQPWSMQARDIARDTNIELARGLMLRATEAQPQCLGSTGTLTSGMKAAGGRILALLNMAQPSAPMVWLWVDNFLVFVYTAMFILGYLCLRQRVAQPISKRTRWCFMALMLLAVGTALADFGENFLLLGGLGAAEAIIDATARVVAVLAAVKINLFVWNVLLLAILGGAFWLRSRMAEQSPSS